MGSLRHSAENWQAQVEELVALQAILPEEFRVLHVPGQARQQLQEGVPPAALDADAGSSPAAAQQWALEDLLGSEPPSDAGLIVCELSVSLDPPEQPLQLLIPLQQQTEPLGPSNTTEAVEAGATCAGGGSAQACSSDPAAGTGNGHPSGCQCREPPLRGLTEGAGPRPPCSGMARTAAGAGGDDSGSGSCSGRDGHHASCPGGGGGGCGCGGGSHIPVGCPVRYVPPLSLRLVFPLGYPGQEPPEVSLSAPWLGSQQRQQLQAALTEAWQQQGPGSPVCYLWAAWLSANALQALGIQEVLVLPPEAAQAEDQQQQQQREVQRQDEEGKEQQQLQHQQHERQRLKPRQHKRQQEPPTQQQQPSHLHRQAAQRPQQQQQQQQPPPPPPPPQQQQQQDQDDAYMARMQQLALEILSHSSSREQAAFAAAGWPCAICFEHVPGASCCRMEPCGHVFCRACLSGYFTALVGEGAVQRLCCPDPSCRAALTPGQLRQLLPAEQYARWEALLLQRTLDSMQDLVYCPRCEGACIEDADHLSQCAACLYAFCALCGDSWHPGNPCLGEEQKLLVLERRKQRSGAADPRREADLVNQIMSLKVVAASTKPCPCCNIPTDKNSGCNKMTCSYCAAFWCWRCGIVVDGYAHFANGACVLFEQAEIDAWNAQLRAHEAAGGERVLRGQAMLDLQGARARRCPVCGTANAKLGRNNLMRCWACSQAFCGLCRSWLRSNVGSHFMGSGSCKQHTDD